MYRGKIAFDEPERKQRSDAFTGARNDREYNRLRKAAWVARNREKVREYMREYMRAYRRRRAS
jgi:hypothetical protein